jgi:hypothetical protein
MDASSLWYFDSPVFLYHLSLTKTNTNYFRAGKHQDTMILNFAVPASELHLNIQTFVPEFS